MIKYSQSTNKCEGTYMHQRKHEGLELVGIIIIYVVTSLYALSLIVTFINYGFLHMYEFIGLIIVIASLILTILYHINIIKNHILIGVIGIFTGFIIGGVYILIYGSSALKEDEVKHYIEETK